jgi:hypothetical protein
MHVTAPDNVIELRGCGKNLFTRISQNEKFQIINISLKA